MGHFITKTGPDDDFYILWSTVVDAPIAVFESTKDLQEYLENDARHWSRTPMQLLLALEADGSTAAAWKAGTWEDPELVVMEGAPPLPARGHWVLPRGKQTAYALASLRGDHEQANTHLEFRPAE